MANYRLSNTAKEDLISIHHFGVRQFGLKQADRYFNTFFKYFEIIGKQPLYFEAVDFIRPGFRRCACGSDTIYFKINPDDGMVEIMTIIGKQDFF